MTVFGVPKTTVVKRIVGVVVLHQPPASQANIPSRMPITMIMDHSMCSHKFCKSSLWSSLPICTVQLYPTEVFTLPLLTSHILDYSSWRSRIDHSYLAARISRRRRIRRDDALKARQAVHRIPRSVSTSSS